ncbi:MAG: lipoprotein [Pseudohongiellaceae bacterium]
MRFPTSKKLLLIVLLACALYSCGQKGPLQRPDQTSMTDIAVTISVS